MHYPTVPSPSDTSAGSRDRAFPDESIVEAVAVGDGHIDDDDMPPHRSLPRWHENSLNESSSGMRLADGKTEPRTGAQYLAGLNDGRFVTYDGEHVDDICGHPAFSGAARTLATFFNLIAADDTEDLSVPTAHGRVPCYTVPAFDAEDVLRRGRCFWQLAQVTGGLMGRSPDFLGSLLTSWSVARDVFGQSDSSYAKHVTDHHALSRDRRLCHTHAVSDPPSARGRHGRNLQLRRVKTTSEGIVVSGIKMLATLAPFADEMLIYPFRPLQEDEADQALAFSIPVATPGLRLICRPSVTETGAPRDRPLASRFDEMDSLCVFDRVLVPHERVFINGDVALANSLRPRTGMTSYLWHQCSVRAAVKARFLLGTASLVAKVEGRHKRPAVMQRLGEMAAIAESLRALVVAAEVGSSRDQFGAWVPAWEPLGASGVLGAGLYSELMELLQLMGSSGLIMHPTHADLESQYADDLRDYFCNSDDDADWNASVLRMAGELAVGGFGGRQILYERFYLGDPDAYRQRFAQGADLAGAESLAASILASHEGTRLATVGRRQ